MLPPLTGLSHTAAPEAAYAPGNYCAASVAGIAELVPKALAIYQSIQPKSILTLAAAVTEKDGPEPPTSALNYIAHLVLPSRPLYADQAPSVAVTTAVMNLPHQTDPSVVSVVACILD